jgi:hypothetical protein
MYVHEAVQILSICALSDSNKILIPLLMIPLVRGLDPIANKFVFGIWPDPDPDPDPLHFQSDFSKHAYAQQATQCLMLHPAIGLSHWADQYWTRNSPHLPFGRTYHS